MLYVAEWSIRSFDSDTTPRINMQFDCTLLRRCTPLSNFPKHKRWQAMEAKQLANGRILAIDEDLVLYPTITSCKYTHDRSGKVSVLRSSRLALSKRGRSSAAEAYTSIWDLRSLIPAAKSFTAHVHSHIPAVHQNGHCTAPCGATGRKRHAALAQGHISGVRRSCWQRFQLTRPQWLFRQDTRKGAVIRPQGPRKHHQYGRCEVNYTCSHDIWSDSGW